MLGVCDPILASAIKAALKLKCDTSESTAELIRGIRFHASKLLKGLQADDLTKAQLGLGHSYSRSKLKFNVNRVDNMIIQAIALLDQLDKDVNLFSMRIREWYGYHFPELVKIVPDNYEYARAAKFIGAKEALTVDKLPELAALLGDDTIRAQNVIDAAAGSMGSILSDIDMLNISAFATRVVSIADYRKSLTSYLAEKMNLVAPSLTALLGERIGARLISHAGSLTNLSKYPASTVQILGAEKALFRALKTKGNTPKVCHPSATAPEVWPVLTQFQYGLIYHSSFIGRAGPRFKGRISRFLANKCSIASRIDCFSGTHASSSHARWSADPRLLQTHPRPSSVRRCVSRWKSDSYSSRRELRQAKMLMRFARFSTNYPLRRRTRVTRRWRTLQNRCSLSSMPSLRRRRKRKRNGSWRKWRWMEMMVARASP